MSEVSFEGTPDGFQITYHAPERQRNYEKGARGCPALYGKVCRGAPITNRVVSAIELPANKKDVTDEMIYEALESLFKKEE